MGNSAAKLQKQLREQKLNIERGSRSLQRDLFKLQRNEQATTKEIKRQANLGQIQTAKLIAKDLVRQRKSQERVRKMIGNLDAIALQITSMASTATIAQNMKAMVKSMTKLNGMLNNKELGVVLHDFNFQTAKLDDAQEQMNAAVDMAMDTNDDEEEQVDELVQQVFDELGIQLRDQLPNVPQKSLIAKQSGVADKAIELHERMGNL